MCAGFAHPCSELMVLDQDASKTKKEQHPTMLRVLTRMLAWAPMERVPKERYLCTSWENATLVFGQASG